MASTNEEVLAAVKDAVVKTLNESRGNTGRGDVVFDDASINGDDGSIVVSAFGILDDTNEEVYVALKVELF